MTCFAGIARRFAWPCLVLIAVMSSPAAAQLTHTPEPGAIGGPLPAGLSPERLRRIDTKMRGYVNRKEAAGALGLIARHGHIGYFETWGDRDREAGKPMTKDAIFRIYSMSKPITSVAVMMLHEEGHFFLNDPVSKYLPELANMQVQTEVRDPLTGELSVETKPANNQITIRDLLRHTAGFTYGFFGDTGVDKMYREQGVLSDDKTLAGMVTKLSGIPLRFEPGTHWHYSVSVDVAGRLVEVVSEQPFDEFLCERIFEPLRMVDTGFSVPAEKRDRFAQHYKPAGIKTGRDAFLQKTPKSKAIEPLISNEVRDYTGDTTLYSGGGGLVSTARDYLRFCQMMLNGGRLHDVRILSRKSVELMTQDHLQGIDGYRTNGLSFGLGYAVVQDLGVAGSLGSPGTYSWGGAAGTVFWIDPQEQLIGIFMVQIMPHPTRMRDEFRLLTYQAIDD